MDDVDNIILFNMLRNPRGHLADMSVGTDLTEQDIYYRLKRIKENNILEKYMLHTNPRINGKREVYLAFDSTKPFTGEVDSVIKCFEKLTVYGISGDDSEINKKIQEMKSVLGNPVMEYEPEHQLPDIKLSSLDYFILKVLLKNPMTPSATIAKEAERKVKQIESRLEFMRKNNIYTIIPKINLSRVNLVIVAFFSMNIEKIVDLFGTEQVIIHDSISGLALIFEQNMIKAKSVMGKINKLDPNLDVMIVYDYEFYN